MLNPMARRPWFQPGIVFCLKVILRWAVALLGLRIALGEIAALGWSTAALVVAAMAITVIAGFLLARVFGQSAAYGALAGAGTAVCGASATLATSIVVPDYKGKEADVAFIGSRRQRARRRWRWCSIRSSASWLGFDAQRTGVMLGATIHDVAQVVGAGYAVSETTGNTAVIVKLFRVFLLFPVVLVIGWSFARRRCHDRPRPRSRSRSLRSCSSLLCLLNSIARGPYPGLRADQSAADRGIDLGTADRDQRARSRHLAARHRRARLASRRDGDRDDGRYPGGGDGRTDAAAVARR